MRSAYILVIFSGLLGFFQKTSGQKLECGTVVTDAQKTLEATINITEGKLTESLPQLHRTLSISIFLVKNNLGEVGVSYADLQGAIDKLNQLYKPIDLKFKICDTTHIPNYQFDNISATNNEAEIVAQYFEKNTINLYLASNLSDENGNQVYGYSYMPSSKKDRIFIDKTAIKGTNLAHQMGHFLNLYHTHESVFGNELVSRSNCATTGDKCCDTEADPNITGLVDENCVYTGSAKDLNGTFYQPKPKNIMSFSTDICRCNLSRSQYLRVIYTLANLKKDLR